MTRGAIRKTIYLALIIVAGAVWWFGGIGRFKGMMEYVLGMSDRPEPKAAPPSPQPVAPTPQAPATFPPPKRPSAEAVAPEFVQAQALEAKGDLDGALSSYDAAYRKDEHRNPYSQDSLLRFARILIMQNKIEDACHALWSLKTEYPTPRMDLFELTTSTERAAGCIGGYAPRPPGLVTRPPVAPVRAACQAPPPKGNTIYYCNAQGQLKFFVPIPGVSSSYPKDYVPPPQ